MINRINRKIGNSFKDMTAAADLSLMYGLACALGLKFRFWQAFSFKISIVYSKNTLSFSGVVI